GWPGRRAARGHSTQPAGRREDSVDIQILAELRQNRLRVTTGNVARLKVVAVQLVRVVRDILAWPVRHRLTVAGVVVSVPRTGGLRGQVHRSSRREHQTESARPPVRHTHPPWTRRVRSDVAGHRVTALLLHEPL